MGGEKAAPIQERIANGKVTGRIRLLPSDDIEAALNNPDLRNLRAIDLSKCNLKRLPAAIGTKLLKIQVLKLSDNSELESLPFDLASCKELRKVDCTNCSRLASLEVLPKGVEELELGGCALRGLVEHPALPLSVQLAKLNLSRNIGITGFGRAFGFEILENLVELDLSFTSLEEVPEEIGYLKSLLVLKLEGTRVSSLPSSLFTKTPVSRIELRGAQMTKDQFLALEGVGEFMKRRKARLDREIAGGVISTDRSVCGLD